MNRKTTTNNNLKFGLNLKSGSKPISKLPLKKPNALNLLDDDDNDTPIVQTERQVVQQEITKMQSKKFQIIQDMQEEALKEDPNVFDYDAVYDDLKRIEMYKKQKRDGTDDGSTKKKARYMENLIKTAKERKIYLERAEQRRVQKERETNEELYGNKEEFVTDAYLAKQAELKRLEEEERIKELQEADPNRERDITGFYRDILEKVDDDHSLMKGPVSQKIIQQIKEEEELLETEKSALKNQLKTKNVQLNDNEEVVDKRQLLSGGLNLTAKTIRKQTLEEQERQKELEEIKAKKLEEEAIKREYLRKRQQAKEQHERNRKYVEEQKMKVEEEKQKARELEEKELTEKLKSKVSNNVVMDAKARYLARKNKGKSE
ncbi:coiled-coil domain-containing protein 55-domain containing protein [Globomyces pollinis-pini]|nr:coiled-coil domain-containing protein 55-domain containing protein [Globomyces pollinis-pini]